MERPVIFPTKYIGRDASCRKLQSRSSLQGSFSLRQLPQAQQRCRLFHSRKTCSAISVATFSTSDGGGAGATAGGGCAALGAGAIGGAASAAANASTVRHLHRR